MVWFVCGSTISRPVSQHFGAEEGGALPDVAGIVVVLFPLDGGPVPGLNGEVLRAPGGTVVVAVTAMPAGGDEGAEEFWKKDKKKY